MKFLFFLLFGIWGFCSAGQELEPHQVPPRAKETLAKYFPGARDIYWEKDELKYAANFFSNKGEVLAHFDVAGNLLQTVAEVDSNEVPLKARAFIHTAYPNSKIMGCRKVTDNTNRVRYTIMTRKEEFLFDDEGVFIE